MAKFVLWAALSSSCVSVPDNLSFEAVLYEFSLPARRLCTNSCAFACNLVLHALISFKVRTRLFIYDSPV